MKRERQREKGETQRQRRRERDREEGETQGQRREGDSGEENWLKKWELVKACCPPGRRGNSAAPSANVPEGLGKAEETTGTEWGPRFSRWVSQGQPQGQPQGPLSVLEMVGLEFLCPSLSLLGLCRGCVDGCEAEK